VYRKNLINKLKVNGFKENFTLNCSKYKELFKTGDRVRIRVNYSNPSWDFADLSGTIDFYKNSYWCVKLEKEYRLIRTNNGIVDSKLIGCYYGTANGIRLIDKG